MREPWPSRRARGRRGRGPLEPSLLKRDEEAFAGGEGHSELCSEKRRSVHFRKAKRGTGPAPSLPGRCPSSVAGPPRLAVRTGLSALAANAEAILPSMGLSVPCSKEPVRVGLNMRGDRAPGRPLKRNCRTMEPMRRAAAAWRWNEPTTSSVLPASSRRRMT